MQNTNTLGQPFRFRGFRSPNYTNFPDEAIDELMPILSGAEWKVLSYIIRRTFGFKKESDAISFSQICNGITTKDGRVLDRGTGLSKSTAQIAVKGLADKNIIIALHRTSRERGNETTTYSLNLMDSPPYTENRYSSPIPEIGKALYRKSAKQETELQETVLNSNIRKAKPEKSNETVVIQQKEPSQKPKLMYKSWEQFDKSEAQPEQEEQTNPGFENLGHIAKQRKYVVDQEENPRSAISSYIADFAREFRDEASLTSSVTRAVHLYEESGLTLPMFISRMKEAQSITKESSSNIKKQSKIGDNAFSVKNKMPYYFSVLRDKCGLKREREDQE